MRLEIGNEIGQVKLGDILLPGAFQSFTIKGKLKVDEIDIPGQSGKSKQPLGFEDATLSLTLILLNDDTSNPYTKLATIVALFQSSDNQAKPYIYPIVSKLTSIWNIREVMFEELNTNDSNKNDTLQVELVFSEYKPVMVKKEDAVESTTQIAPSDTAWADYKKVSESNPSWADFRMAENSNAKSVTTPAIDDDEVA